MKKLCILCTGMLYACVLPAQPGFQTSLQAGISLPVSSNTIDGVHTGKAIHFGNHLDYSFGSETVSIGLGAYIGFINATGTDNKYKEVGQAIAEKYRLATSQLNFSSTSFKSTHILLGPVASFGSAKFKVNLWAKGGYGLNEPSRYAVLYKEGNIVNNIYINQAGENKNGLAYSAGAGVKLAISPYVGLQLAAGYFSTQTDQVNYNYDREKGTNAKYFTSTNQFVQASAGLQFTIGNTGRKSMGIAQADTGSPVAARMDQKIKTKSNIKNDRVAAPADNGPATARMDQKIKTKSNIKNDRMAAGSGSGENELSDSLFFSPEKIELRSMVGGSSQNHARLQSVDNYLTGFVYNTDRGAVISQCGSNAMPGDPIPGLDVKLRRLGAAGNDVLATRTNKDGSFSFNNIAPGDYQAEAGKMATIVRVNSNNGNALRTLDIMGGSCGNTKENYIITTPDKTFVEIISGREAGSGMATGKRHIGNVKYEDIKALAPRDAASGLATGKRMHKPYRVADTDFDINPDNIVSNDGKFYAEVISSREAGSGMGSGRRSTIITGDVDGDGMDEYAVVAPRDAASGLATGRRMHKPMVITKELEASRYEVVSPRDAASGLATGKRLHKPMVITKELNRVEEDDEVTLRDAGSGMATGKRMHKPFVIRLDDEDADDLMATREAGSGMATGRRQYQPLVIRIYPDEDSYEVVSPRDAASGLATGRRMHKPMVITKEINRTENGEEVTTYRIVHRDVAARSMDESATTDRTRKETDAYQPWDNDAADEGVVSNPLYEQSGAEGTNPMFEAKSDLRVTGSNGKEHTIFMPDNIVIQPGTANGLTPYSDYGVAPIRWMAPESLPGVTAGKSINEKGVKRTAAGAENNAARKGWDGSVKGSGKNISGEDSPVEGAARKGWDGTVKGSGKNISGEDSPAAGVARKGWDGTVKGGSIVQRIDRMRCANGTCAVEALVESDGIVYEAVITGILKTKHDTVKNSINNVR